MALHKLSFGGCINFNLYLHKVEAQRFPISDWPKFDLLMINATNEAKLGPKHNTAKESKSDEKVVH